MRLRPRLPPYRTARTRPQHPCRRHPPRRPRPLRARPPPHRRLPLPRHRPLRPLFHWLVTWKISFRPYPELFARGNDPLRMLRELNELGSLSVETSFDSLPEFSKLEPQNCYLSWSLELTGDVAEAAIREVFDWADGDCDLDVVEVTATTAADAASPAAAAAVDDDIVQLRPHRRVRRDDGGGRRAEIRTSGCGVIGADARRQPARSALAAWRSAAVPSLRDERRRRGQRRNPRQPRTRSLQVGPAPPAASATPDPSASASKKSTSS